MVLTYSVLKNEVSIVDYDGIIISDDLEMDKTVWMQILN